MSDRLLLGTRKGLFRIQRGAGGRWRQSEHWFAGDPISMLLAEANGPRRYAALGLGHFGVKLQSSMDGGQHWEESPMPKFPAKPEGLEDKDPMRNTEVPWSTQLIWALEQGGAEELWCGVAPGAVFHSPDWGETWQLCRSLWDDPRRQKWMGGGYDFSGVHSVVVDPRDPAHITVAVSVGGVWTSHDRGAIWRLIGAGLRNVYMPPELQGDPLTQDPHRVVACAAQPERLWMQHHNGIFVSDDAGEQWREIESVAPSSFGFAVVVHPQDPDTAWFVPADKDERRYAAGARLAVTRTRDGGRSFETLRTGLPEEPTYDLVYRHALAISDDGERLAFGSTTGGCWVSEDQGDSWRLVSAHLPPINCVRFEH